MHTCPISMRQPRRVLGRGDEQRAASVGRSAQRVECCGRDGRVVWQREGAIAYDAAERAERIEEAMRSRSPAEGEHVTPRELVCRTWLGRQRGAQQR
jgi:hypothetical protein